MKNLLLLSLVFVFLTGCSTVQRAGLAGLGAAGGSLLGPAGAAVGAVGGVIASDVIDAQGDPIAAAAKGSGVVPQGSAASTIHESKNFIQTIGWWYLIIFILIPLLTKKGRSWIVNLATLHNTATKKDVDSAAERLHNVEGLISSLNKEKK